MDTPTLERRVEKLEQLLERVLAYARSSKAGRIILEKIGLEDA